MKDILKMIFMCLMFGIFFLTFMDLFATESHKFNTSDFTKQVDFILKVNPKASVDDIVTISDAITDSYFRTGLSKIDFMAIAASESRFKKNAVGRIDANDKGLFQVNYYTWKYFKEKEWIAGEWKDIFIVEYNTHVASVILMKYREHIKKIFPEKSSKEINKILIESFNKGVNGAKRLYKKGLKLSYYEYVKRMRQL